MRYARRTSVCVALIGAVTAGGIATTAGAAPCPSHATVTGGSSKITLRKSTLKAMKANGFKLSAIHPATFNGKTLKTPIKSGSFSVTSESALIVAAGGFKIAHGGKSVSITKVHSKTTSTGGSGTAVVTGVGRIAAIKTGQPSSITPGDPLKSSGFSVTLAKTLVNVLDTTFDTTLFRRHATVGTGSASLKY